MKTIYEGLDSGFYRFGKFTQFMIDNGATIILVGTYFDEYDSNIRKQIGSFFHKGTSVLYESSKRDSALNPQVNAQVKVGVENNLSKGKTSSIETIIKKEAKKY